LSKSNLNITKIGSLLNLETSLKAGNELSGHLVFGHIDGKLKLIKKKKVGSSILLIFNIPSNLRNYIAPKGSISINGVSLTINNVSKNIFDVNIISHTLKSTNFNKIKIGELLNIEVDMIARYVSNYLNYN
jgi:riboflavin synthase